MKRDRLYTVNKGNKAQFARDVDRVNQNIFAFGDSMFTLNDNMFSRTGQWGPMPTTEYLIDNGIRLDIPGGLPTALPTGYTIPTINSLPKLSPVATSALKANPLKGVVGGLKSAGIGIAGNIANQALNKAISGGFSTGVGNGIANVGNAVGQIVSVIPGVGTLAGPAVQAISGAIGGLWNHSFGKKTDEEKLSAMNNNAATMRSAGNQLAQANDNAAVLEGAGKLRSTLNYNPYKGGWLKGSWERRNNNAVNNQQRAADVVQTHGLLAGIDRSNKNQADWSQINSAAYGGLFDTLMGSNMDATTYGLLNDYLTTKRDQNATKNKMPGIMPTSILKDGGEIHIKKANRGKFTEQANRAGMGVQEYAAHVLANKEDYPTSTVMRANFARNFGGRHAFGGPLDDTLFALGGDVQTHGSDFTTGMTHIDAGGSHESNPNDGVQVGVDPEGKPNLVEEGEVIFNDYVYSNRISLDEEAKKKFHISKKREITYADMAKKLEAEISERPNDPISKAGFKEQMEDLAEEQERQKADMQAEEAREAFNALSPEEQVALMQEAQGQQEEDAQAQQEAMMQEQAMQEQAMAEQQGMVPEEQMMQGQGIPMQEGMPPEAMMQGAPMGAPMAYGGPVNRFDLGGDIRNWLKTKNVDSRYFEAIAKAMERYLIKRGSSTMANGKPIYTPQSFGAIYDNIVKGEGNVLTRGLATYWNEGVSDRHKNHFKYLTKQLGMDKETAFALSMPKYENYAFKDAKRRAEYDKEIDAARRELIGDSKKSVAYIGRDGRKYNTLEEANAAGNTASQKQSKESGPWRNTKTGERFATKEEAEKSADEYNKKHKVGKYRGKPTATTTLNTPTEQAKATVSQVPVTEKKNARTAPRPISQQGRNSSGLYAGEWIEGDSSANWNAYSSVGLKNYLQDVVNRINNAETDEQKNAIREEAINKVAQIQQAYATAYQPNITPTSERPEVLNLQTLFDDAGGNAGFEKIADNIKKSNAARNKDTAANRWRDSLWGPRTSIRNWGSTEYGIGNQDYYNEIAGLATQAGLKYAPNTAWTYGKDAEGNPYQLYGLSRAGASPENVENIPSRTGAIYHAVEGDEDYLPDSTDLSTLGSETRRVTTPDGDTVIYHASNDIPTDTAMGNLPERTAAGTVTSGDEPVKFKHTYFGLGDMGPLVGLGMQAAGIGKPNLRGLEAALSAVTNTSPSTVNYKPIGNYLRYDPMDIWAEQNKMNATSRGTARAIQNNSGPIGTQTAGLLAASLNDQQAAGDLYRKALEYNNALNNNVANFNRATDQFNAEAFNRASMANAEIRNRDRQLRAQLGLQTEMEKLNTRANWYKGIYGNIDNFFQGLGAHEKENRTGDMIAWMINNGVISPLNTKKLEDVGYTTKPATNSNGGSIKRKKKRGGLTY